MRLYLLLACGLALAFFATPGAALECDNIGTAWTTQPDDTGDSEATACGDGSIASGNSSTALGVFAASFGGSSIALGYSAATTGSFSTALGYMASASGGNSVAVGAQATADGQISVAHGLQASSMGDYSISVGYGASSAGESSTALGRDALSVGLKSTAIGFRASAPNPNTIVLGSIPGINDLPFDLNSYADVAIGTISPLAPLHVARSDGTAQILVEETNTTAAPRTLFRLASAGSNAKFEIDNTAAGEAWAFTNSGSDFRISRQGSGVVEFRVDNAGNAFVAGDLEVGGNLTTNLNMPSDRGLKQNIEALDPETVLEKVAALPVTAWEYSDRPGERHIGPMAQDFHAAFGLGSDDTAISVVDASGVALASIKALAKANHQLTASNQALKEDVEQLKALVMQLLPQVAQN